MSGLMMFLPRLDISVPSVKAGRKMTASSDRLFRSVVVDYDIVIMSDISDLAAEWRCCLLSLT